MGTECIPVPPAAAGGAESGAGGVEYLVREIALVETGHHSSQLAALRSQHAVYVQFVADLRQIQTTLDTYTQFADTSLQEFLDRIRSEVHQQWLHPVATSLLSNNPTSTHGDPDYAFVLRGCWVVDHPVHIAHTGLVTTDTTTLAKPTLPPTLWSTLLTSHYVHVYHATYLHIDTTNVTPIHLFVAEDVTLVLECTAHAADMHLASIVLAVGAEIRLVPGVAESTCVRFYRMDDLLPKDRMTPGGNLLGPSVLSNANGVAFDSDLHRQFSTLYQATRTIADEIEAIERQSLVSILGSTDLLVVGRQLKDVAQTLADKKLAYAMSRTALSDQFGPYLTECGGGAIGSLGRPRFVATEGTWLFRSRK
jgi:hypothetical protein